MSKGKVKWFSNTRGYGFILADGSDKDIFFHHSSIQMDGYRTLKEGDAVEFELVDGPKGPKAENVAKAEAPPAPQPQPEAAPPMPPPVPPSGQDQPVAPA